MTKQRAVKRAEGVAALSVLTGMSQCASALEAMRASDDPLLQSVLFSGLVVSYARAFENVGDAETQTARSFRVKKLSPPFDKTLHDSLLTLRNQQIAHAGHVLNDYSLTFMSATMKVETPQSDGTIMRKKIRKIVGTRARASLACGPATTDAHEKLLAHIRALEAEAGQRLGVAIIEHDLASLSQLQQPTHDVAAWTSLHTKQFAIQGPAVLVSGEEDLAFSLAKAPEALLLAFAVMHYNLVEKDGAFTLKGLTVKE